MARREILQRYIDLTRRYLRDFPELNRLIEGVENSDALLSDAVIEALEDYNTTPPHIGDLSLENFPAPMQLRKKAAVCAMSSASILQMRNQLSYSDGQGTSVSTSDKAPMYQSQIRLIDAQWDAWKMRFKIARNIENGWGAGAGTELGWMGGRVDYE